MREGEERKGRSGKDDRLISLNTSTPMVLRVRSVTTNFTEHLHTHGAKSQKCDY